MAYGGYTDKKKESNRRYLEKQARLTVWLSPEEKALVGAYAKEEGLSVSNYVRLKLGLRVRDAR